MNNEFNGHLNINFRDCFCRRHNRLNTYDNAHLIANALSCLTIHYKNVKEVQEAAAVMNIVSLDVNVSVACYLTCMFIFVHVCMR